MLFHIGRQLGLKWICCCRDGFRVQAPAAWRACASAPLSKLTGCRLPSGRGGPDFWLRAASPEPFAWRVCSTPLVVGKELSESNATRRLSGNHAATWPRPRRRRCLDSAAPRHAAEAPAGCSRGSRGRLVVVHAVASGCAVGRGAVCHLILRQRAGRRGLRRLRPSRAVRLCVPRAVPQHRAGGPMRSDRPRSPEAMRVRGRLRSLRRCGDGLGTSHACLLRRIVCAVALDPRPAPRPMRPPPCAAAGHSCMPCEQPPQASTLPLPWKRKCDL